ncbi:MAG: hypothetical protein HQL42_14095 [Alphaproteobacteria bacterium]|nr:hypothetical protein [Alphaproteobacteria bacterium]
MPRRLALLATIAIGVSLAHPAAATDAFQQVDQNNQASVSDSSALNNISVMGASVHLDTSANQVINEIASGSSLSQIIAQTNSGAIWNNSTSSSLNISGSNFRHSVTGNSVVNIIH